MFAREKDLVTRSRGEAGSLLCSRRATSLVPLKRRRAPPRRRTILSPLWEGTLSNIKQRPPNSSYWTARFRLLGQSGVLCQGGSSRWTPWRAVWKGISSPRPKPNSRPRACSSVGVDWAALGRHFDTDIDPAGCLLSGLAEWHEGGHATVLAEGGRRKMSPGSSQMGLREPRATAS